MKKDRTQVRVHALRKPELSLHHVIIAIAGIISIIALRGSLA